MKPRVIVSVSNDLVTDHRVHKTCTTLTESGWEVLLMGRLLPQSPALKTRAYTTKRIALFFKKGPLFYAEMNIRYFFVLLFSKANAFLANDLDTLPANFLASKIRRKAVVYDSHEYYTEVPELVRRPKTQKIWKQIEKIILPHIKYGITVTQPIADLYFKQYGVKFQVVINAPKLRERSPKFNLKERFKGKKIILVQGGGINIDRGMEELIEAMQWVGDAVLLIVGAGDVIPLIKKQTEELGLQEKVIFYGRVPLEQLGEITPQADLGLSIDKATNLNYTLSLPNKLFDYIHAELPLICTALPEVKKVVEYYQIGVVINNLNPVYLAEQINAFLANETQRKQMSENCKKAKAILCWDKEEQKIKQIFSDILGK